MNKNILAATTTTIIFVLSFLCTVNTAPVKPPKKMVAAATTATMSISFGGGCAHANKDNTCDSGAGEACTSDTDCCGSLKCTGATVTREGETYNTCQ